MPTITAFVARLSMEDHLELANALGAGLTSARISAELFTGERDTTSVVKLTAQISHAIRELERARAVIQRNG